MRRGGTDRGYPPCRMVRWPDRIGRLALPRVERRHHAGRVQVLMAPFAKQRLGPESIREIVFGVEDGMVQNMTLIAGMVGATLSDGVIVLAGVVNAVAGVLSMSMGTFLSSQAERDALLASGVAAPVARSPLRDAGVMAAAYGV